MDLYKGDGLMISSNLNGKETDRIRKDIIQSLV